MNSLKNEIRFLFSGQGMPYEKVCLMVAMVVTVLLTAMMSHNFAEDARVTVIDMDNTRYSHEIIDRINASEYMKVTAVLNNAVNPEALCYRDQAVAVVYLRLRGLRKTATQTAMRRLAYFTTIPAHHGARR